MRELNQLTILLICSLFLITSCQKNAPGGKASISGKITYSDQSLGVNNAIAPGAVVKIAYGATSAPSSYDSQTIVDANGNYNFSLYSGDYYIYVIYDAGNSQYDYTAGGHVKIGKTENATLNLNAQ